MPVILHPDTYDLWPDEDDRKTELLKEMLCPYPASEMVAYPVRTLVNSPWNQGVDLIDPTVEDLNICSNRHGSLVLYAHLPISPDSRYIPAAPF
jgi:hypothetical protein